LYSIAGFKEKISQSQNTFNDLAVDDTDQSVGKITVINELLKGAQANGMTGSLKVLKISTPFGFTQDKSGVLTKDSSIIYQSPTGLFERSVRLTDL
jgi:CRISPR-associated endonuclease Csn1